MDKNLSNYKTIYDIYHNLQDHDFVVGEDDFNNVRVDSTSIDGFWYLKNIKKGYIKRFILQRSDQVEKICVITLIQKENGKFTPRFDFQVWNITKKAIETFQKDNIDQNLIKAKVNLDSCYKNFLTLINFIKTISEIDFESTSYAVVDKLKKDIFDNVSKEIAINSFVEKYGEEISEKDIEMLDNRRSKLIYFKNLLDDINYFESERIKLRLRRKEDLWQNFFENNSWIFGYGLQLVACEGLNGKKLEQTVVGNDIIDGSGKRIDALLKTKGTISKILFCEIKTHLPNILIEEYERPGVYVPAKELRGAVAQIQKTIHKVTLKLQQNFIKPVEKNGDPTGEEILFVKPRGIVVIGKLTDFVKDNGINYEKLSSFELFRQQISGIEIITFDELYERVKFIIEE